MTTHTPGPWELLAGRTFKTCNGEFYLAYGSDKYGNPRFCSKENGWPEMDANARLVAAAPDLLEALKAVEALAYELRVSAEYANAAQAMKEQVKRAIAKAEGKP
jgi:hypothetical protein